MVWNGKESQNKKILKIKYIVDEIEFSVDGMTNNELG